jgi:hypothetical protein
MFYNNNNNNDDDDDDNHKKIILSHETINSLFMGELSNENDIRHVRYFRVIIIIYDASV